MIRSEQYKIRIFQSLYVENVAVLIRFALRYVSLDAAEDIVQEVFLDIWKNERIINQELNFSYLLTAVRNKCINHVKQKELRNTHIDKLIVESGENNVHHPVEKNIVEKEYLQRIYDQIDLLPNKCKTIFKMAYFEEKKSSEIAEILNLSIRTVEHQLYLGLKTVRNQLKRR
ncbi:MAG: RNA polymerase sigma-70 factor [Bacteroidales bacterium]|jgi:RNA polymerase sigma-70 factor (ECF subfamily)|nr:RNA polymerase sigma-70 factor [Bacteroidales bacterium]